jgi:mannose-6-phosphate isomerase-like protein (cupin superfamily)
MPRIHDLPKIYELDDEAIKKLEEERLQHLATIKPQHTEVITGDGWYQRPWGRFLNVVDLPYTKVKRLIVNPGKRLSYQSHTKRDETWIVVRGVATVTIDDFTCTVNYGEHVCICKNSKHRLANETDLPLEIIEVQVGEYFGEDDIQRYEDDFGRL